MPRSARSVLGANKSFAAGRLNHLAFSAGAETPSEDGGFGSEASDSRVASATGVMLALPPHGAKAGQTPKRMTTFERLTEEPAGHEEVSEPPAAPTPAAAAPAAIAGDATAGASTSSGSSEVAAGEGEGDLSVDVKQAGNP